jgi:type I restriction enzyme, S subunit
MDAEQLLEHFDRVAEAPGSIAALRRFILDLAVRGKLVDQDPNDEPASELLKRIQAEKTQLQKAGKIRKSDLLPIIGVDDELFQLPKSWVWTRIGEIFNYDAGQKRDPREMLEDYWLLELEDVEKDTSIVLTRSTVADRDSRSTKSEFQVGDILYGKLRPYLNKVLVATEPGYSTTEIVAIRSFIPLCSDYCCLAFRRPDFVDYVNRVGQGTKMPRLRTLDALVALFPLPPLAEQYRIVAKVDELMDLCDRLEAAQKNRENLRDRLVAASLHQLNQAADSNEEFFDRARFYFDNLAKLSVRSEHIKQLRQTILNLAVCGKLVPQESLSKFASLQTLLAESSINGVSKGPTSDTSATEVLRISAGTSQGDFYVNEDDFKHVDLSTNEIQKFQLEPGDLLACRFNGNLHYVGRFSYYRGNSGRVQVNPDKLIRFRIDTKFYCPRYVCYMMNATSIRAVIEAMCATTVGNIGVSSARLKTVEIPVPSIAKQHAIVSKVDELIAFCDELEAQISNIQSSSYQLLESLIARTL